MIEVQLNKQDFEYDIHSLVRAFYPGTEVSIFYGESPKEESELKIVIRYETNYIEITIQKPGEAPLRAALAVDYRAGRKEVKNSLKALLYQQLEIYTDQELPWGNLTGIRPTKIPMALLETGKSAAEISAYMQNTYFTSKEKANLAVAIAVREKHILEEIHYKNGYSLYIGIPFCPSICLYCSFSSSPLKLWENQVDTYLEALCQEISFGAVAYQDKKLDTIYIGGGTPTTLTAVQLERVLQMITANFDMTYIKEFTVEAGRPDSITEEKLQVLRAYGVSRISINPQTMNQKTLDIIGRKHTVEETKNAFLLARKLGFDNINMDLIVGLPGEEISAVEHTLREVSRLAPDSITVHSLAVKRAARLQMFKDEYREMTFTNSEEIMDMAAGYAKSAGMAPYYLYRQKNMAGNFENVGYAREGKEGIYNILIMEEKQSILALGAGASTKVVQSAERIDRIENVKDIKSYIERIDEMIERKKQGFLKYGK